MMKILDFKIHSENKFTHMLVVLTAVFLLSPFLETARMQFPLISVVFFCSILFALRVLNLSSKAFFTIVSAGLVMLILESVFSMLSISRLRMELAFAALVVYAVCLFLSIVMLIKKMFSSSRITGDTIRGGMSVYLLLGYFWTVLYYIILLLDPKAFYFAFGRDNVNLFYFSFTTLTTVGYGDVYPLNEFAMTLANLEAIVGQLYLGIFIARMVGLHIIHHHLETKP